MNGDSKPDAPPSGQTGVQSVGRALDLLELLSQNEEGLRASDLARLSGLAMSTTHRLLTTLEARGFAHADPDSAAWHVGRTAFAVGSSYGRRRSFVLPALPYLRRLRDQTRETANLGVLDRDQLVTISQVESREIVRAIAPPGGLAPIVCSGMGKALLATWPDAEIASFVARTGLPPMTPHSLTSLQAVMADIALVRQRGYAVDDEERNPGLRCVAAPVWSASGEAVCAISISGLAVRLTLARIPEVGAQVRAAAEALSEQLGHIPDPA